MGVSFVKSTMSPSPNSISLYKAQTKIVQLNITELTADVDGNLVPTPFNLTGCSLYLTVRTNGDSPRVTIAKSTANSAQISITSPPTLGQAVITFVPIDTQFLICDKYQYDVWVVTSSNQQFPVIEVSDFIVQIPITQLQ
jgi:hypothetical protein